MTDLPEVPSSEVIENVVLSRLRVAARQRITGADMYRGLKMSVRSDPDALYDAADDLVMQIVGHVYKEDLPPEQVTHTTTVKMSGRELGRVEMPATWWQHWKEATAGRWWRWLVPWLRPVRRVDRGVVVPWSATRTVTCTVDLRRFYVYPESQFGDRLPIVVGSVRVPKHQVSALWTDEPGE